MPERCLLVTTLPLHKSLSRPVLLSLTVLLCVLLRFIGRMIMLHAQFGAQFAQQIEDFRSAPLARFGRGFCLDSAVIGTKKVTKHAMLQKTQFSERDRKEVLAKLCFRSIILSLVCLQGGYLFY